MLTLRPPMVLGLNLGAMARYVAAAVLLAALVAPCDCDCVCVGSGYSDADGYRGSGYADADGYCTGPAVAGDLRVFGEVLEDSCSTAVVAAPDPYPTCTHTCCTGAGAACVSVKVGGTWKQEAYLKAPNAGTGDNFGRSVAISGDTVVVGAPHEPSCVTEVINGAYIDTTAYAESYYSCQDAGAAYVFRKVDGAWVMEAYLKADSPLDVEVRSREPGGEFGHSVSIDGDTIVVECYSESACGPVTFDRRCEAGVLGVECYWERRPPPLVTSTQAGVIGGAVGGVVLIAIFIAFGLKFGKRRRGLRLKAYNQQELARVQQARADVGLQRPPAQAAATAPVVAAGTVLSAVPASDPVEALQKIGKLRDDGVITEDEFQAKKSELLARM